MSLPFLLGIVAGFVVTLTVLRLRRLRERRCPRVFWGPGATHVVPVAGADPFATTSTSAAGAKVTWTRTV